MAAVSVAGIALRERQVLIARRLPGGDLGEKWEFPGGKVEPGESCEEALVREFGEEFGVSIQAGELLASSSFIHKGQERLLYAYRVFLGDEALRLREHSELRWASLEELGGLDFAGSDQGLLAELKLKLQ
ncbi:MAG: (deoxy)nucleoside triphosphate pyrophosphohydrolase [Treponema sp.]|jgi:8-oxo-dGTP diphosphatase|nr:(deoxy)nucleoside triphosphate pyrophosphohydrolase [Treponema sp.]